MSKDKARGEQSYKDEELLLALVPVVLEQKGFTHVRVERRGGMKLVDARTVAGEAVKFWLKQGWPNRDYSAIQFGMFGLTPISRTQRDYVLDAVIDGLIWSRTSSAGLSKGLACGQADGPSAGPEGGLSTGAQHPLGNPSNATISATTSSTW